MNKNIHKVDYSGFYDPYPKDISKIEESISSTDNVLDIGAWWKPLNRANTVIDMLPYNSRGGGGRIGQSKEYFTKGSWIKLDICSDKWPFKNKEFDFVHCGQTLEDIRDPIFVCKEMMRVARKGVVTTPTIWIECQKGIDAYPESTLYKGFDKHKWLVKHTKDGLKFIPKLSSLMAFDYVDKAIVDKFIVHHRIWSDVFFWEDHFDVSEAAFLGFTELKPVIEKYFTDFDYKRILSA